MTLDCGDPFNALGVGITYLREELGVSPDFIITHSDHIRQGNVVIVYDQKPDPWVACVEPHVRWATIKGAIGI